MRYVDPQLEIVEEQIEGYASTFRWIFWLNLAALVWAVLNEHHDVAVLAGITAVIALFGVGMVRRGLKAIGRAIARCQDIRKSRSRA